MPFCMYCGNKEPEAAVYCGSCGRLMTMPTTTTKSNNLLLQKTIAQIKNDPLHRISIPGIISHQELVSEIEEEPHTDSHHEHRRKRWVWRHKNPMGQNGTVLAINLVLVVVLVVAAITGALKGGVFYKLPFGNNSPHQILVNLLNPQAVFASYVGNWEHHGESLAIKANLTGLELWHVGPCTQSPREQWCNGSAEVTFTVNPDGSIRGTVQSVWYIWYTSSGSEPVPAGYKPDPYDLRIGDIFELQHDGTHLLSTTWLGKSSNLNENPRYWCDTYAENAGWGQYCGA